MPNDRYNQPEEGVTNWHQPLNENFDDLDRDVVQVVDTWSDLPDEGTIDQSSSGQWPQYLVLEDKVVVRVTDGATEIVGGLGSADHPLPEQHVGSLTIGGSHLYVQPTEPSNAEDGDVWIDTS